MYIWLPVIVLVFILAAGLFFRGVILQAFNVDPKKAGWRVSVKQLSFTCYDDMLNASFYFLPVITIKSEDLFPG